MEDIRTLKEKTTKKTQNTTACAEWNMVSNDCPILFSVWYSPQPDVKHIVLAIAEDIHVPEGK